MNLSTWIVISLPALGQGFIWSNNLDDETLLESIQRLDREWSRAKRSTRFTVLKLPEEMIPTQISYRISREEGDEILNDILNATSPLSFFATSLGYTYNSNGHRYLPVKVHDLTSLLGSSEQFYVELDADTSDESVESED